MAYRLWLYLVAMICLAGCGALAAEISSDMAPQISTEVAMQIATAVSDAMDRDQPVESVAAETRFDCESKTCGNMTLCEEAVYKLNTCRHSRLDSDGDGIPCESICTAAKVENITGGELAPSAAEQDRPVAEEIGPVTRVVDGDTIYVELDGKNVSIRFLQMNTPERDQPCYTDASEANKQLVEGKTVRLVPDKELVDRYDRLLRFVYVDDVLVNRVLVEQGFAEVVLYPPNDAHYDEFVGLEAKAAAAGLGCHPTGIFDDDSTTR